MTSFADGHAESLFMPGRLGQGVVRRGGWAERSERVARMGSVLGLGQPIRRGSVRDCLPESSVTMPSMAVPSTTIVVQRCLDDLAAGDGGPDDHLIRALLERSVSRLQLLCGRLLYRSYPRLTRAPSFLETDDLLSAVVERLIKALREVRPGTVRQFFALANRHIRWELNDLARKIDRQDPAVSLQSWDPEAPRIPTNTAETGTLLRILAAIETLPDAEREVFEYVRLQGMTHAEVAEMLGVSLKTVQRRLRRGVLLLSESLGDLVFDEPGSGEGSGV